MTARAGFVLGLSLGLMVCLGLSAPGSAKAKKKPSDGRTGIEVQTRSKTPNPKPLMKIISRKDGKFVLEPLSPPPGAPVSEPRPQQEGAVSPASWKQPAYDSQDILRLVLSQVQTLRRARYARGASLETSSATDCSGLVQYIYRGVKVNLPRTSAEQARVGWVVSRQLDCSQLSSGDLLFFRDGGRAVGHAGIYLGDGKMLHASRSRGGVAVADLHQGYYLNNFVVATRVLEKRYNWPAYPGLSPAVRYRDWDSSGVIAPPPVPKPPPPPLSRSLLKIFWPGEYQG